MDMNRRLTLLHSETDQDSQALETDVMRFVAIIGIVFWIIFALVKSIPMSDSQTMEIKVLRKPEKREQPLPAQPVSEKSIKALPVVPAKAPETPVTEQRTTREEKRKKSAVKSPAPPGLNLQFRSMDDLLELLESGKIEVYSRASATGFDLFFKGRLQGGEVVFHNVNDVPDVLWEIKSGRDYAWFSAHLTETCPAVKTFPVKQVLINFRDRELEQRLDKAYTRLQKEGKNGVLSVTGAGDVVFEGVDKSI